MAYEGGYTSAVDSAQRRAYEQQAIQQMIQLGGLRQWEQQEQQKEIARKQQERETSGAALKQMFQQVQPPPGPTPQQSMPPGQSSQPMAPPQGPPPQGALGGASMAPPGAAPAAPPMPWQTSPAAPPGLGGKPPGPPGMGPTNQVGPPPTGVGGEQGVIPPKMLSVPTLAKTLADMKVPDEQIPGVIESMMPMINEENRRALDEMKMKADLAREIAALTKARTEEFKARNPKDTAAVAGAKYAAGTEPGSDLLKKKLEREGMPTKSQRVGGGGTGGTPGKAAAFEPAKDEAGQIALDAQSWNYILKGTLPYRKGTGGGKDANDRVMHNVGRIAQEFGMSGEELAAAPATFKADAQSLAFQTKKVDAITSTLNSFHNNIDTWNSLAKGEAPKLGGERVADASKTFSKIYFSDVKTFNDVKLKIGQEFNDPTIAAYMTSAMAVAMDFARIMQGPQSVASLTEGARNDAMRLIAAGANDKARAGILAALESDAQGQVKGITDRLATIRKRMQIGPKAGSPGATSAPASGQSDDDLIKKYLNK